MRTLGNGVDWLRPGSGNGLRFVALLAFAAVFIQVTFMPRLDIFGLQATPNLAVAVVVAVGALRGVVVGAVTGFSTGFLVELLTPGETLGVLALAYVVAGAYCGRYAAESTPIGRPFAIGLMVGAAALVPVWFATVEYLQGEGPPVGYLLGTVVIPQIVFAPLVAVPAWWAARKLLGAPREVEPWVATPA